MPPTRNTLLTAAVIGSTVLAVSMLGMPTQAATTGSATGPSHVTRGAGLAGDRSPGYYDARQLSESPLIKADRAELSARSAADTRFYRSLGAQGVVDLDPLTGTPRDLGRLNGFLTGRSPAPARTVAMNFVRLHLGALGLTRADLKTFRFRQDYVDAIGVHNLSWTQSVDGTTVFGNGLLVRSPATDACCPSRAARFRGSRASRRPRPPRPA